MRISLLACCLAGAVVAGCAGPEAARQVDMRESDPLPAPPPREQPAAEVQARAQGREQKPAKTKAEPVVVTPSKALVGQVIRVNKNARFAVMTFPVGQMPAVDQKLSIYRNGLKVGEVKISPFQRDDKMVGDIVAGESEVGDQVSDR